MMGLWADGWFYISSAGLLVSGILFFFLLGQYRVASEAADATEGEQGAEKEASSPAVIRPVYIPEETPASRIVSHAPEAKAEPKPEPKPKADAELAAPERRKDPANSTGGISPAVVYLQNIKVELADLHKDLRSLAKRVDDELASVSTRDEALIERLGELARAVEGMKAAARAEAEPAPKRTRKAEKAPEPEPIPEPVPEPVQEPVVVAAPEPEPAPAAAAPEVVIEVLSPPPAEAIPEMKAAFSPDETIRMDLSALVAPEREPEPAPKAAEPAPVEPEAPPVEKPRRGPVWPV